MSAVYFSNSNDVVALSGSERALCEETVSNLALGLLEPLYRDGTYDLVVGYLPKDNYLLSSIKDDPTNFASFIQAFKVWFRVSPGDDAKLIIGDRPIDIYTLVLNTASIAGSDVIYLMAMVHYYCERHGYILPEDFSSYAAIIDHGLASKVLRPNNGWESVVRMLRTSKEPIVMSFSGSSEYPNPDLLPNPPFEDDWETMSHKAQFCLVTEELITMEHLRVSPRRTLCNEGLSVFDIIQ